LEAGQIDGFWANAMGAETAVSRGVGKVLVDVRRGEDPGEVRLFTFAGMVTSDIFIERNPAAAAAAVRAIVKTQKALKADPRLASEVGRRKFPKEAADLISTVVNRDLVFYDPVILQEEVEAMNRFAQAVGHLSGAVPYDEVVATRFRDSWQ